MEVVVHEPQLVSSGVKASFVAHANIAKGASPNQTSGVFECVESFLVTSLM
jgi:hypothetical protein